MSTTFLPNFHYYLPHLKRYRKCGLIFKKGGVGMKCNNCGSDILKGEEFCPVCNSEITESETQKGRRLHYKCSPCPWCLCVCLCVERKAHLHKRCRKRVWQIFKRSNTLGKVYPPYRFVDGCVFDTCPHLYNCRNILFPPQDKKQIQHIWFVLLPDAYPNRIGGILCLQQKLHRG